YAGGWPDRRREDLADHSDRRRRASPDRPGDQAAAQAGQRAQDPRPGAGRDGGARARTVQARRRGRGARPDHAVCRDLSRQRDRRLEAIADRGGDRNGRQDRGLRGARAPVRPDRDGQDGGDRRGAGADDDV
ncbi:MAG: Acetolactate synthase small subunit, partial [uncultured Solirubrobacterales bacterium]